MGRLWARTRKNKESATFEYDKTWLEKSCAILPGSSPAGWSRPVSHVGRHAHVRRARRQAYPPLIELPNLLSAAEHVMEEKDTDEELGLLFAPGSPR